MAPNIGMTGVGLACVLHVFQPCPPHQGNVAVADNVVERTLKSQEGAAKGAHATSRMAVAASRLSDVVLVST
jgi:hypothetical protein